MHEAGLASSLALRLRDARQAGVFGRPRLVVRGGHDEPMEFDAALRLHLSLEDPELGHGLEIIHLPVLRLCSGCGAQFSAVPPIAACPTCGSPALPSTTGEQIELDWDGGKAV